MISADRSPLWYKDAVIYGIDVSTFMDSDGDGVGDFEGLRLRLDYLASLGVTCLWLLPFFPTPNQDNGYDIVDYYDVSKRLGTLGDYVALMHDASSRGLHIIVDLVVNHTSDQHPWFQQARADKDSPYRDYYVWTDEPPARTSAELMFPEVEKSIWTWDDKADAYYLHQFYRFEPDLNIEDSGLRQEIRKIIGLWLELGASGFRVDAANHMLGDEALRPHPDREPHEFLRFIHDAVSAGHGNAMLLAEADVDPDQLADYFGNGSEMNVLYNFLLDSYLFLAFAREEAEPIARVMHMLPKKPRVGQWMNFLRNLDELDIGHLSDDERQTVYTAFAPFQDMRIYDRGIRRRIAPMFGGNRRRIELAFSLLFSLPGTPMIVYGDEIGMGDDLSLTERWSVRTPMQWSGERDGGFSNAPTGHLTLPVITDGPFGYPDVNVLDQRRDKNSLLNWMSRVIHMHRQNPEIGRGDYCVIGTNDRSVFAHRCDWGDGAVVAVHNLASAPRRVSLDVGDSLPDPVVEIFGSDGEKAVREGLDNLHLDAYGYRWFHCGGVRL